MSMQTAADITLIITSDNTSSERRVTPSWTISQLKAKLESVTGIPPTSQKLALAVPGQQGIPIEAADEDYTQLATFPLAPYAEIHVRCPQLLLPKCHVLQNLDGKKSIKSIRMS